MVEAGFLSPEQARNASQQPLRLSAKGDDTGYPYPVDFVAELLPEFVGEQDGDLIVETTIDAGLQRVSQQALRHLLDEEGADVNAGEGAVVVLDPMGGVKALVGGRSYSTSPFDRALKSLRQPGSAFKPFVYLAALESGYTPDSIAYDGPTTVAGWSPRNYTGIYQGEISLRDALAQSINTVAARLAAEVGPWRVVRTARRLGIHSKLHDNPSIALGTAEVTLLELTGAYTPFANGGQGVLPHIITRVRNGDGKVLYERQRSTIGQVVALQYVAAMNDMMYAVGDARHRQAGRDRRPSRGRKDRHDAELPRRLVHRLHGALRGRGVDRQRQRHAHEEGHGRHAAGQALARDHGLRASRQDAARAAGHARATPRCDRAPAGELSSGQTTASRCSAACSASLPGSRSLSRYSMLRFGEVPVEDVQHLTGAIAMQARAMLLQPAARLLVARHGALHQRPESRPVIHVTEMGDLVRGEIIEHEGRSQHEPPGEGQSA